MGQPGHVVVGDALTLLGRQGGECGPELGVGQGHLGLLVGSGRAVGQGLDRHRSPRLRPANVDGLAVRDRDEPGSHVGVVG